MALSFIIVLALLATLSTLGLGLLSMAMGGSADKQFGERFMWARIVIQAIAVLLIALAVYLANK